MAISKNKKNRIRRRQRLHADVEESGSSEAGKDGIKEQTLNGDQAPNADAVAELQEELRQARGDLLLLRKSNKGFRSSNTALQKKLDDQTGMLEKEQEFNAALVDGLRQQGTRTISKASGRYETVACWEYLEQEPDSWRRYLPDAEQSLEEAHESKLTELIVSSSGFRYRINLSAMMQTNVDTRRTRAIRRREILLHADAVLKMIAEIQNLRGENQRLTVDLCSKSGEIQALEQDIQSLQDDVETKKDIIRSLNGEIDELHASHGRTAECLVEAKHTARKKIQDLEQDIRSLQDDVETKKDIIRSLNGEIDELHSSHEQTAECLVEAKHTAQKLYTTVLSQLPPKPLDESARGFCRSLDVDDPKYLALLEQFQSSMARHRLKLGSDLWCDPAKVSVTRIEELVHPANQLLYEAARRIRASEDISCGCTPLVGISAFKCEVQPGWVDMNEYLLYHGTSRCNAEQIMTRGFDAQRGGELKGAMFGRGVYFAQNASKSDFYTTCDMCEGIGNRDFRQCRHAQGERCILVTRVLLGESKTVKSRADAGGQDQIRAPRRDDGTSYDSITALAKAEGGVLDHKEFVVFKDRQTLASFRIFYRHDSSCSCNGCQHRRSGT